MKKNTKLYIIDDSAKETMLISSHSSTEIDGVGRRGTYPEFFAQLKTPSRLAYQLTTEKAINNMKFRILRDF